MNESVGLLIAYLASLAKVQAEKLVAAQIQLFRLKSMTVPVEPTTDHCPSCAALRARLLIVEHIHAFLLRLLKRAEVPYLAPDKAWICAFVEQNAIPKKEVKRLFGISTASYYRWRTDILGWGVAAFRHLAKALPDTITFWAYAVKAANPSWGKLRISQAMARLGIPISPSSVWRYLRRVRPMPKKPSFQRPNPEGTGIPAAYPNHYWAADTTTISVFGFFRIRILAVIDLYSRKVLALRAFFRVTPSDVRLAMGDLFVRFGRPKHFLTDHGGEFSHLDLGIDHRFGRVACPASTARVERFFRSLKWECLRHLFSAEGRIRPLANAPRQILANATLTSIESSSIAGGLIRHSAACLPARQAGRRKRSTPIEKSISKQRARTSRLCRGRTPSDSPSAMA